MASIWDPDGSIPTGVAALIARLIDTVDPLNGDKMIGVKTHRFGAIGTDQDQVNDERTSVFQYMDPLVQIPAIISESGSAAAECAFELQNAIDNAGLLTGPVGTYVLEFPLTIKDGNKRFSFKGDTRIRTTFVPGAVDIKLPPENVNALFNNKENNAHFCLENFRMTASNGYTGKGIYSVEGGGSDGKSQCIFSAIQRNGWIDFGNTNTGYSEGAYQNSVFDTMVFENMKNVFNIVGIGNLDNFYNNFALITCFEGVTQTTDTQGSYMLSFNGWHVYNHQRGILFNVQNWVNCSINDVSLESKTGAVAGDAIGFGKFKDCTNLSVTGIKAVIRTGVPILNTGIEVQNTSGKFSKSWIQALVGLKFNGGTVDLSFEDIDFTGCTNAAFQNAVSTAGVVRTTRCKFNSSQIHCAVFQVGGTFDWISNDDEFVDAGLGGNVNSRCLAFASSGIIKLYRPKIGRTTGGAAAQYWYEASGTGTVDVYDPVYVGLPPTGLIAPASTQAINFHITQNTNLRINNAVAADTLLSSDGTVITDRAAATTYVMNTNTVVDTGIIRTFKTNQAQTVSSTVANVIPLGGGAAAALICAAVAGQWRKAQFNGTNWVCIEGN